MGLLFRVLRYSLRKLVFLFLITAVIAVAVALIGIPDPVVSAILRHVDPSGISIEVGRARLDLMEGLVFSNVKVYRKGVVGPSVLSAGELALDIDPLKWLRKGQPLDKVVLRSGEIRPEMLWVERPEQPEEPFRSAGPASFRLIIESCRVWGMQVEQMDLLVDYSARRMRIDIEDGCLVDGMSLPRNIYGRLDFDEERRELEAEIRCSFNPQVMLPMLNLLNMAFTARLVSYFDFRQSPPRVDVDFLYKAKTKQLDLVADVRLPASRFRGEELSQASGSVVVRKTPEDMVVKVDPLVLVRPEGVAKGSLAVSYQERMMHFDILSGLAPPALFGMIGFRPDHILLSRCRYNGPASISADGRISFEDKSDDRFNFSFSGSNFSFDSIVTDECNVKGFVHGRHYNASNVQARVCGGDVSGGVFFVLSENGEQAPVYQVNLELQQADFSNLLRMLGVKQLHETSGKIGGRITAGGVLDDTFRENVVGDGIVRIRKGHIFRLPLFGGLSDVLSRMVPGLDFVLRQSDADADFEIENGIIHSEQVRAQGDVFSLDGSGHYDMVHDSLDYSVQVKLMKEHTLVAKILRTLTYPISKLLEFRLRGSLSEPRWYPVNFSTDLLRRIGGAPDAIRQVFSTGNKEKNAEEKKHEVTNERQD